MPEFGANPEEIRSVAQRVQTGADDAEGQRTVLLGQIQGLQGNWQGKASDALQDLYLQWDQQAKALNETLTQIAQQMNHAADDYDQVEDQGADRFRA